MRIAHPRERQFLADRRIQPGLVVRRVGGRDRRDRAVALGQDQEQVLGVDLVQKPVAQQAGRPYGVRVAGARKDRVEGDGPERRRLAFAENGNCVAGGDGMAERLAFEDALRTDARADAWRNAVRLRREEDDGAGGVLHGKVVVRGQRDGRDGGGQVERLADAAAQQRVRKLDGIREGGKEEGGRHGCGLYHLAAYCARGTRPDELCALDLKGPLDI